MHTYTDIIRILILLLLLVLHSYYHNSMMQYMNALHLLKSCKSVENRRIKTKNNKNQTTESHV